MFTVETLEKKMKEVTCYPTTHSRLLFSGIFPSVICVGSHKDKLFYNLLLHFCCLKLSPAHQVLHARVAPH